MKHEPLIDVAKLGQAKQKCICWWGIGWAAFAAGCAVALYFGIDMSGVL